MLKVQEVAMTTSDKEYFDARFDAVNAHIDRRIQELKAELHQTIAQTIKWSAAMAASTLMIFVTIVAFLMNNAAPRTIPSPPAVQQAPAAVAQPQPIVIIVPLKP
jgi:hypothetical protein